MRTQEPDNLRLASEERIMYGAVIAWVRQFINDTQYGRPVATEP